MESGATVRVNTVDHGTFQEQINKYLQGKPDDVFTWFAGYRMQFFASQGLALDISDVWSSVNAGFTDALRKASTGEDGVRLADEAVREHDLAVKPGEAAHGVIRRLALLLGRAEHAVGGSAGPKSE